jgi:hypothetical protein
MARRGDGIYTIPLDPHDVRDSVSGGRLERRHPACAASHLRVAPRDGRRRPAHDSRVGRLGIARDGRALHAPVADPQGRDRRADCPEFPNAIHNSAGAA